LKIPTANLLVDEEYVVPNTGVYAGCVSVDDTLYYAMINIGKNPTFENEIQTIEAHILNFDQDLYEKEVRFYFYKKIRDEKKFKNIDELKDQLVSDIKTTQNIMTSSNEVVKNTAKTWDKKLFM
jgi:riboflavin kinase/FMN adenylyltransferase